LTLQDLGNIGELIAAIATIATLGYLALQIRQNAKSVQGATAQAIVEQEAAAATLIAQHANIYRRGNASIAELNADERVVYEQIIFVEVAQQWSAFSQHKKGLISQQEWAPYHSLWEEFMAKPGFRSVWEELKCHYPEDFCQYFDEASTAPKGGDSIPD